MTTETNAETSGQDWLLNQLRTYPLLDSLTYRRSRRFAPGLSIGGGPLSFQSELAPAPLTEDEEAALVYAACGFTGYALGELPYQDGGVPEAGGGNIMSQFYGRTAASGDAIHAARIFVMNDEGTWMIRRPLDCTREEFDRLARAARDGDVLRFYRDARVRVADKRIDQPRAVPYVPGFNQWAANRPGTTYFVPIHEMSSFFINVFLLIFDEEFNYFLIDDTALFKPAGIGKFAKSKGGRLNDDPKLGRALSISMLESWMHEFAAVEQGGILQNLGLMTQALGLGGFPHFAHHPWGWGEALGFTIKNDRFTASAGMIEPLRLLTRLLRRDFEVPVPLGLTVDGVDLIKPFCPPYYPSMADAVAAYLDLKFGPKGSIKDLEGRSSFASPEAVTSGIPRPSQFAIDATIACCTYIYKRFGRFPATNGPIRTVLAYQANHLDPAFYERYYKGEALSDTQRAHRH